MKKGKSGTLADDLYSKIQLTCIKIQICGRLPNVFLNLLILEMLLKIQDPKIPFFSGSGL
jgi:hypothetical protein